MKTSRSAFTLIELLVVLTIFIMLMGLSLGALARVRISQQKAGSRDAIAILQKHVDSHTSVTIDKARRSHHLNNIMQYCGGDKNLATSVVCYAYMKVEFPESFAEAKQGFKLVDDSVDPPVTVMYLPPPSKFNNLPASTTLIAGEQAAVLLHLTIQASVQAASEDGFNYYKDNFGKPIMFVRWYEDGKVGDTYDPMKKLPTWDKLQKLRDQANCQTIGNNLHKTVTVCSFPSSNGEVLWGHQLR